MWEVRVFTGADARGNPTQLSRTVRGGQRDVLRVAAELEVGPGRSSPASRNVSDVLDAWVEQNFDTWVASSARDQQSRVRSVKKDQISRIPLARLSVADVERWHTRMRKFGYKDAGIRNLHGVLRAALAQAERWGWVTNNVAAMARLRSSKVKQRSVMTVGDVRAVMAALRWTDEVDGQLTIDSSIEVVARGESAPRLRDAATKTANERTVTLDAETVEVNAALRSERAPYGPWMFALGPEMVTPDRIGWWWRRARKISGIDPKWRLHDMRHWSATVAIGQGHDVRTVAGRLGHANPAMTLRIYAHAFAAADQALAAGLGDFLRGKKE